MRNRKSKRFTILTLCVLPSCILIFTSVLLFVSLDGTFLKEFDLKTGIGGVFKNNRHLKFKLSNDALPEERQNMEAGEGGVGVNIDVNNMSSMEILLYETGRADHYFNQIVSDKISVHRSLPDCRSQVCKEYVEKFNGTLPELSVVIIFHNEAWTPLLRSVHSVLSRTPANVLKEIILVDDNSTFDHLQAPLNKYFSSIPKVKIIRAKERVGLIRARLLGFEASVAPVVAFLDSHIECFPGWAESMLIRILINPKAVVFPVVTTIKFQTFEVGCLTPLGFHGGFMWKNLAFDWVFPPQHERERVQTDTDPFRSPVMPGGLFAIGRAFFNEVGTYDPDLGIWGAENMELSFKTWMCGGTLELDRCSLVGHVFRYGSPIRGIKESALRNSIRVAEVWMDDYKNYFYEMANHKLVDPGNLTDRINLRQRLQCKSFDWYLKNVYPEKKVPHSMKYAGEIKSSVSTKCLDSNNGFNSKPTLSLCMGNGQNQVWYMGATAQIMTEKWALCVFGGELVLQTGECQIPGPQWEYRQAVLLGTMQAALELIAASDTYLAACVKGVD